MNPFEDEAAGRAYDRRLMRRFLGYLRPVRGLVALTFVLLLLKIVADMAAPLLLQAAMDGPVARKDRDGLILFASLYGLALAVFAGMEFLSALTAGITGQKIILGLRLEIFRKLEHLPVAYFDRNAVGRLVVRTTNDVENLNELFTSGLVSGLADLVLIAGVVGVMIWISPALTLATAAVVPLIGGAVWLFGRLARERYRELRRVIARLNAYLSECLAGVRMVKSFGREEFCGERFRERSEEVAKESIRTVLLYSIFLPFMEFCLSLLLALLLWYGGARMLDPDGAITFGTLVSFWYCLGRLFHPLRDLGEKYNVLQAAMASSERIFKILDTPEEPRAAPLPGNERGAGEIEFRDVEFSYDGETPVLRGVSFRVAPGEKVAVVGLTGAGKTTLLHLLLRFYEPRKGEIRLGGRRLAEIDPREVRRRVALVSQDVFLFMGTVEENLRLGRREIPWEEIERTARRVGLDRVVARWPEGYRTQVKERGVALSAGERQVLSLARALSFDPEVVLLDEATSYVDMETERWIQEATRELLKGRSALIVAHRLGTVRDADRILVMHRGRIVEQGTHAELLARGQRYAKLCRLQFQDAVAPPREGPARRTQVSPEPWRG